MEFLNGSSLEMHRRAGISTNVSTHAWVQATAAVRYWLGIWMLLISCLGTPANMVVLECARRLLRRSKELLLPQYFVCSMTLADFVFTSVYASSMYALYSLRVEWTPYQCGFIYGVCHCCSVASSLSLFCLNVDKFLAITRPLRHVAIMTRGRVLRLISLCWIISFTWAAFFVTSLMSSSKGQCGMLLAPLMYYCIFTVTFFIGPTLAAFFLSLCISIIACRRPLAAGVGQDFRYDINCKGKQRHALRSPLPSTNSSSDHSRKSSAHNRPQIRPAKALTFVFATTAWSFLTCVPYRIMYLFYVSFNQEDKMNYFSLTWVLFAVMAMNSLGNPFITIFTQRRYLAVILQQYRTAQNQFGEWQRSFERVQKGASDNECGDNGAAIKQFGNETAYLQIGTLQDEKEKYRRSLSACSS